MIQDAKNRLQKLLLRWKALLWLQVVASALLLTIGLVLINTPAVWVVVSFLLALGAFAVVVTPWKKKIGEVVLEINRQLPQVQHSAQCLLESGHDRSVLVRLQQQRAAKGILDNYKNIRLPISFSQVLWMVSLPALVICALWVYRQYALKPDPIPALTQTKPPLQSAVVPDGAPEPAFTEFSIRVTPPAYTGLAPYEHSDADLEVVENASVVWKIALSTAVDSAFLTTSAGKRHVLAQDKQGNYVGSAVVSNNGFYSFTFVKDLHRFDTDLFSIRMLPDRPPELELPNAEKQTRFEYQDTKRLSLVCEVADDYGVTDAYLVATVSKGSGEAVKFREERLRFDEPIGRGSKKLDLSMVLDLEQLQMSPGDELYFYVEATDNKYPKAQRNRTDTYFLAIKDTTAIEFSLAGSLGVDMMPEYFRSQRQIIIDTEKLIPQRKKLLKKEFEQKSNVLAHDQKSLRIRYGQFMGEEFESTAVGNGEYNHDDDGAEKDPISDFAHHHDHDNEHNLVEEHNHDHDHGAEHKPEVNEGAGNDPLKEYQHVHDDPEEATFFTVSIKQKLRQALAQMWDAELYLRLYQPKKSLPYQYRALRLLKEIKNHARIYVHRIGFDPPPIKEDNRLKAEISEVKSKVELKDSNANARKKTMMEAIALVQGIVEGKSLLRTAEIDVMEKAGDYLAQLAIDRPGAYLHALELLRNFINSRGQLPVDQLVKLTGELSEAVQNEWHPASRTNGVDTDLSRLVREQVNIISNGKKVQ